MLRRNEKILVVYYITDDEFDKIDSQRDKLAGLIPE